MNKVEPGFLYLLGALRDGSVYYDKAARNYVVAYYQKNQEWLVDVLIPLIRNVLGKKPIVDEYKRGQYRLRIYSKEIYGLLKNLYGFPADHLGQASWGTPDKLRELQPSELIPFIRGFFDAEGDIKLDKDSPYIGFSQKNKEILHFIKENLEILGIRTGKIHLIDSRSHTFRFVIASEKGLVKFIETIGSSHPEKITKLRILRRILGQHT
uniref:Homing endonuclease I-ApeI n=1 Tax=Caldiarchaeum subterraneum TaxID=311458 RepID=E6N3V6_CALS0|nr:homing endonuclease I-ApeI [Candidatus Caldarchaeum subterraneum]